MSAICYLMALDYGCCSHKNLGMQLLPTIISITLTPIFTLPESPVLPWFTSFKLGTLSSRECSML